MKKLAFIAVFALAACSQAEDAAPVAEETAAAPELAAVMAADGKPPVGTYEITSADGQVVTEVVNADGTYSVTDSEDVVVTGTWTLNRPDNWCSKLDGSAEENCFKEEVNADGVWTSVNVADPADNSIIVRKM